MKIPAFPSPSTCWQPVRRLSAKPQGEVWLVRCPAPGGWKWGFFKYAGPEHRYYAGPMVANEWIAARLLRALGLPVAPVIPARIGDREGIVSVALAPLPRIRRWCDLPASVRRAHLRTFFRPSRLYGMIAFDVWTTNIDRGSGRNILVYRLPGQRRYRFYLVDHALALHGSYYKWDHYGPWPGPRWNRPWRVYTVPQGLVPTRRRLQPWVARIAALPPRWIQAVVQAVPERFLSPAEAAFTLRLLLERQKALPRLMARWTRRIRPPAGR